MVRNGGFGGRAGRGPSDAVSADDDEQLERCVARAAEEALVKRKSVTLSMWFSPLIGGGVID
jgi:hypothetical protein